MGLGMDAEVPLVVGGIILLCAALAAVVYLLIRYFRHDDDSSSLIPSHGADPLMRAFAINYGTEDVQQRSRKDWPYGELDPQQVRRIELWRREVAATGVVFAGPPSSDIGFETASIVFLDDETSSPLGATSPRVSDLEPRVSRGSDFGCCRDPLAT